MTWHNHYMSTTRRSWIDAVLAVPSAAIAAPKPPFAPNKWYQLTRVDFERREAYFKDNIFDDYRCLAKFRGDVLLDFCRQARLMACLHRPNQVPVCVEFPKGTKMREVN